MQLAYHLLPDPTLFLKALNNTFVHDTLPPELPSVKYNRLNTDKLYI